jgi:hypothetical protein
MTIPIPDSFENRMWSRQIRMAWQVGHSLRMLAWASRRTDPDEVRDRLVAQDIFLVHTRLLCEFLLVKPSGDNRDFSINDFLIDTDDVQEVADIDPLWSGPTPDEVSQLGPFWFLASSELMHFSKSRIPEYLEEIVPVELTQMKMFELTGMIFSMLDRFFANQSVHVSRGVGCLKGELTFARAVLLGEHPREPWISL